MISDILNNCGTDFLTTKDQSALSNVIMDFLGEAGMNTIIFVYEYHNRNMIDGELEYDSDNSIENDSDGMLYNTHIIIITE